MGTSRKFCIEGAGILPGTSTQSGNLKISANDTANEHSSTPVLQYLVLPEYRVSYEDDRIRYDV